MSSYLFALSAALFLAVNSIIYRVCMRQRVSVWGAMVVINIIAVACVLLGTLVTSSSLVVSPKVFGLLLLNGLVWLVFTYCTLKAYEDLEASVCQVYDTISIGLVAIAGWVVFYEELALMQYCGITLIGAGIAASTRCPSFSYSRGVIYKLIAVCVVPCAFGLDKYLSSQASSAALLLFSYLVPLVLVTVVRPKSLKEGITVIRQTSSLIMIVPVFSVLRLYFTFAALRFGEMSTTYALLRVSIPLVLVLEWLFLNNRRNVFHKAIACTAAMFGAIALTNA